MIAMAIESYHPQAGDRLRVKGIKGSMIVRSVLPGEDEVVFDSGIMGIKDVIAQVRRGEMLVVSSRGLHCSHEDRPCDGHLPS